MAKRKQTTEDEKENRVSQVVEVVEEPEKSEALETIKEDAQEIEAVAEELGQQVDEPKTTVEKEVADLYQPEISEVKVANGGSSKKLFVWAAIVVSVALLVGGGLVAVTRGSFSVPFIAKPIPTPTPTLTPTPVVTLNREDLKVEVLNGGGTPGAAGKMKTLLEEKGYVVTSIGNTDEYTYEQTQILVKADKEAYINLITKDLESDYTIGSSAATLGDDESADAQVIVGKE